MKQCSKTSNICTDGHKNSKCITYDGPINDKSELDGCIFQYDVNGDLYTQIEELQEQTNLEDLEDSDCISYNGLSPSEVIKKQSEVITQLCARVSELEDENFSNLDITNFGLEFYCLEDSCGEPIERLGQLLQILINNSCE